jgi:ribosomal protein S7
MIPAPISIKNQMSFSVKWIIKLIRDQKRRVTVDEIGDLLLWALENKGASWRKKVLTYKIAIENRYLLKKYFK